MDIIVEPIVYVSTDVEADGPIPGLYSMLSYASVAYDETGREISFFYHTLEELPEASQDPDTTAWWATQPEAWELTQIDRQDPAESIQLYSDWLNGLPGKVIFLARPVSFDAVFICFYLWKFIGGDPFKRRAIDVRSFICGVIGKTHSEVKVEEWIDEQLKVTHHPLEDARAQASAFFKATETRKVLATA